VREIIKTERAPAAIGPYSQAIRTGNLVFTSGQIPIDPKTGEFVAGGGEAHRPLSMAVPTAVDIAAGKRERELGLQHRRKRHSSSSPRDTCSSAAPRAGRTLGYAFRSYPSCASSSSSMATSLLPAFALGPLSLLGHALKKSHLATASPF